MNDVILYLMRGKSFGFMDWMCVRARVCVCVCVCVCMCVCVCVCMCGHPKWRVRDHVLTEETRYLGSFAQSWLAATAGRVL